MEGSSKDHIGLEIPWADEREVIELFEDEGDAWKPENDDMIDCVEPTTQICPLCGKSMDDVPPEVSPAHLSRLHNGESYPQTFQAHVVDCVDACENEGSSTNPHPSTPMSFHRKKKTQLGSAFSVLMAPNADEANWKEAEAAEDRNFRPTNTKESGRRKAPFYKVRPYVSWTF